MICYHEFIEVRDSTFRWCPKCGCLYDKENFLLHRPKILGYIKPVNVDLTDEEKERCAEGNKIAAIKLVRNRTGFGLKESKDIVDEYYAQNPPMLPRPPQPSEHHHWSLDGKWVGPIVWRGQEKGAVEEE